MSKVRTELEEKLENANKEIMELHRINQRMNEEKVINSMEKKPK